MATYSQLLLSGLITYGAPLFGLVLLIAAVGLPIPSSLLVVAAGAFSRLGNLDGASAALMGLAGAVAGDSLSYAIGYYGGKQIQERTGNPALWAKAQSVFSRGSGPAVFLTRFLLTAVALPVNLMAGNVCTFRKFLAYVVAGEALWIVLYGGLGYLFGSQWALVSDWLGDFSSLAIILALFVAGVAFFLVKRKPMDMWRVKAN